MKMDKVAGSGNDEFYSPEDRTCAYCKFYKDNGRENECLLYDDYCFRAFEVKNCEGFEVYMESEGE